MHLVAFILSFSICSVSYFETRSDSQKFNLLRDVRDTVIIKKINPLTHSYEVGFYSRSFTYVWVTGGDTLEFSLNVSEYVSDSTFSVHMIHRNPILFSEAVKRLEECMPLIRRDFTFTKYQRVYLQPPIYYPDLVKALSEEYKLKFGWKNVSFTKLNKFLLESTLNVKLAELIAPLGLEVKDYGMEKFQLISKRHLGFEHPNVDTTHYPDYVLHGMGVSIRLQLK